MYAAYINSYETGWEFSADCETKAEADKKAAEFAEMVKSSDSVGVTEVGNYIVHFSHEAGGNLDSKIHRYKVVAMSTLVEKTSNVIRGELFKINERELELVHMTDYKF